MNPVVHFQLPYEDGKRISKFYQQAFGWVTNETGPEMGNYINVGTTETDQKTMRPTTPGTINGGFYKRGDDLPSQIPNVVIAVEDINAALKKVEEAGGKINSQPQGIPGVGIFSTIIDTEGNHMVLLEPGPQNQ
ncbi:MAG TPA: VOC family protein [Candidatus Paceibacterota bacterium]|nr:VOC family protein [Candidatus Paceibacterota bacterium]